MKWFWEHRAYQVGLMFAFMSCTISLQYDYLALPNFSNQWAVLGWFSVSTWLMCNNIKTLVGDFDAIH